MITTERERLKRAIEQDCLLPTHSNAAYVQSLKQALAEVRLCFIYTLTDDCISIKYGVHLIAEWC